MKPIALFLLLGVAATAEVPVKKPLSEYSPLWTRSPFTSAMAKQQQAEVPSGSIAESWSLVGCSEASRGYRVTLVSRSAPEETRVIRSGETGDFSIVRVDPGNGSLEDLAVVLTDGRRTETLHFDKEILSPEPAAISKSAPKPPRAIIIPDR
jgi:hypothetical protein